MFFSALETAFVQLLKPIKSEQSTQLKS